jgi:hypothetical protein
MNISSPSDMSIDGGVSDLSSVHDDSVLLRAVKREFEFYGIEVIVDVEEKREIAFFVGGNDGLTNVEYKKIFSKSS